MALLGILRRCQSLRDLERFAIHHATLTSTLVLQLRCPSSDWAFRYCYYQVDAVALCASIRDWTSVHMLGGAEALDQLVTGGKRLRGSVEPNACGCSAFTAQVTLYSSGFVVAIR